MIEPSAKYDLSRTPCVAWAGKLWPVPPLPPRVLDMVWTDIKTVTKALEDKTPKIAEGAGDDNVEARLFRSWLSMVDQSIDLSVDEYMAVKRVVYHGLTCAHPELTFDEFQDVPETPVSMLTSFMRVRNQSGMYGGFQGAEVLADAGEAKAA